MKKTFNLDDELCESLEAWRLREVQATGYELSLSEVVSKLLREGLEQQKEQGK